MTPVLPTYPHDGRDSSDKGEKIGPTKLVRREVHPLRIIQKQAVKKKDQRS
jgi:hypothetical protein